MNPQRTNGEDPQMSQMSADAGKTNASENLRKSATSADKKSRRDRPQMAQIFADEGEER